MAMVHSYSPYSKFKVGSALLDNDNNMYTGTNIENASYGATICAERVAIFKAVSEGIKIIKLLVVISEQIDYTYPCGICRQVISEFSDQDTKIICARNDKDFKVFSIDELIPMSFKLT